MTVDCLSLLTRASALYFVLHVGLYVLVLRRLSRFGSERSILLYHLIAAVAFSALVLLGGATCDRPAALTTASGLIFAHGIYSMSFLELWSLAQGSYSLTVLHSVVRRDRVSRLQLVAELAEVGEGKKRGRLTALAGLGLLRRDGEAVELTARGRLLSHGLRFLVWIANPEEAG
jgi:hypothetical protein